MNIDVRFFTYAIPNEEDIDIVEISEADWLPLGGEIFYERHTIYENGVSQVCLTKSPFDTPHIDDLTVIE